MICKRVLFSLLVGVCASFAARQEPAPRPEEAFASANDSFYARRFDEAELILRRLITASPTESRARYLLVRTLIESNKAGAAFEEAQASLRECPQQAFAHVALGDALYRLGRFEQAQLAYQEALRLDADNARALVGAGRILVSEFRFKSAKEDLRKALALDPRDPDIAIAMASALELSEEQLNLEETWANGATYRDPEELEGTRALLSLARAKGAKPSFALEGAPALSSVPLRVVRSFPNSPPLAFLLAVSVNGAPPRELLLDTGAHGLLISARLAAACGVQELAPYRLGGLGDRGRMQTSLGWAESVRIGEVALRSGPVIITKRRVGRAWEGIVGADVLADFLMTLDFPSAKVELKRLDDQAEAYSSDRNMAARPGFAPVRFVQRKLLADVAVGDRSAHFVIDTGAIQTLVSQDLAKGVTTVSPSSGRVQGISGQAGASFSTGEMTLRSLGVEWRQEGLTALDLNRLSYSFGVELGGLLGCDFWRDGVVTIDYRNGLVKFERPQPGAPSAKEARTKVKGATSAE